MVVYRIGAALARSGGKPQFSIMTFLMVVVAFFLVKPGWMLIPLVCRLGTHRWPITFHAEEISRTMEILLIVGGYCLAFCLIQTIRRALQRA